MFCLLTGLILQLFLIGGGYGLFLFPTPLDCDTVQHSPCQLFGSDLQHGPGVMCGSDGTTYANSCNLAQALCSNPSMYIVGNGSCASIGYTKPSVTICTRTPCITSRPPRGTTRPITRATKATRQTSTSLLSILTSQAATTDPLIVICSTIDKVRCASDVEPVCGTDDRTYIN